MAVQRFKTILTIVLGAALLLALIIALFWRGLLTPEQKLRYGLVHDAARDFRQRAASHPDAPAALADYVEALVQEGNLGRAAYLSDLYGVENARLGELRAAVLKSLTAAQGREAYALGKDPAVQAVKELPVREALRYLEGYRHALLGDWASAKNYFGAIKERQLAPELRPYYRYYLARCYRLAGDAEEQQQVVKLLLSIIKEPGDAELQSRARYNLIAWYLSDAYGGKDGLALAKDQELSLSLQSSGWAKQKAQTEFGTYYLKQKQLEDAWRLAEPALLAGPEQPAGEGAGKLCLDILEAAQAQGSSLLDSKGALLLPLAEGTLAALAEAGAKHGYAVRTGKVLVALKKRLTDRARWEELYAALARCYAAEANLQGMQGLMAQANLRDFSDARLAQMYFDYAALLAARKQWNEALSYYRSSAKLGGPSKEQGGAGEAYYRCYAILKQVQDPLDQQAAVGYLREVVERHPDSPAFGKAAEELAPLLIYLGSTEAARRLCDYILKQKAGDNIADPAVGAALQLRVVAQYWLDYMDHSQGQAGDVEIPWFWSYYDTLSRFPPPELAATSAEDVLALPERAEEFFAGLGLDGFSEGAEDGQIAYDPVCSYLELANAAAVKPIATRQWEATELLESGVVQDAALLRYVLREAYPQPYDTEVQAASKRFGVPAALIYAVIKKESSFREDAASGVGAQGLMQLMPPTAQFLISRYGLPPEYYGRRLQPAVNIMLGAAYLANLYEAQGLKPGQGDGNAVRQVLHCYNGGPANYDHWRALYLNASGVLLTELIPNEENEIFAKKVWKYYEIYSWLEQQGAGGAPQS